MKNKTVVITGASRGVGRAIALRAAGGGANVVILAKTGEPHPKLFGTIYTVAKEIEDAGGRVLPLKVDVRFGDQVKDAAAKAAEFGGGKIDALINNASAVIIKPTEKQVQLMNQVVVNGMYFCTNECLVYLQKAENPHVINIAPPLPMASRWFEKYGAYAKAKSIVSKYTLVMAEMYPGISFDTLWPKMMLFTAATIHLFGEEQARRRTRSPEIMADAVKLILESHGSGRCFLDESALEELGGITDFDRYLLPGSKAEDLMPDIFV